MDGKHFIVCLFFLWFVAVSFRVVFARVLCFVLFMRVRPCRCVFVLQCAVCGVLHLVVCACCVSVSLSREKKKCLVVSSKEETQASDELFSGVKTRTNVKGP